jgi:hypothetical protein
MVLAGFFLARSNVKDPESNFYFPPSQLGVNNWKEAYRKFFPALSDGRTEREFHNSLKNIRDSFDSHLEIGRVGWRNKKDASGIRKPQNLTVAEQNIWNEWRNRSDEELWEVVRHYIIDESSVVRSKPEQEVKAVRLQVATEIEIPVNKGKLGKQGITTQTDFEEQEREQNRIGKLSEKFVLDYEKQRLIKADLLHLAERI